jgi:transglutaminase-like putative cysteine protease
MTPNARMTLTVAVAVVLTSTIMYPLFYGTQWFFAGAGAVIAVAASGALSRLRTLPVVVCLAISVLGLLLYLNLVFEARHSLLRVIPTPTSIARLWDLAGVGMTDASKYAPPAPNVPGLVLLAAAGIGITAVLADLIAVRLRSAALAGLPLLVLYTVPITMKAPAGLAAAVVFCLGTAGYLAMLSADGRERIRVWGRLVSLWRYGSLHDTRERYVPDRRVATHNGGVGRAATAPTGAAAGTGTGHRVLGPEPGPDTRGLAAAGRRVGLASVVLALCVPLIVPGLHPSKLFSSGPGIGGDDTGTGSGTSTPALSNGMSQTIADLQEKHPTTVLTYTTSASQTLQTDDPQYLQQYVYDDLTSTGWQLSGDWAADTSQATSIAQPPGVQLSSAKAVTINVRVADGALASSSEPTFLPLPYPPAQVNVSSASSGTWLVDQEYMVFSKGRSVSVKSYAATSFALDPTPEQLTKAVPPPKAEVEPDLQLPSSYRMPELEQIAKTVTAHDKTEYEKVDALASWLSGSQFTYKTTAPSFDTAAGLLAFLTVSKAGVCVQYAYAMTVLARLLGIPARVAGGYTAGTSTSSDSYVVKTSDAHAWTEVYFSGFGWIRFEPTPSGPTGQGTARPTNYQSGSVTGILPNLPAPKGSGHSTSTNPNKFGNTKPLPGDQGAGTGPAGKSAGTPWAAVVLAIAAAIALACGVIAIVAPPAHRVLSSHSADAARRPRRITLTTAVLVTAAAAIVALALYRLLAHTSGLDLGVGWATVGIAFGAACAVMLVTPAVGRIGIRRWRWIRANDDVSRAHTAWREFRDDLEDFGVGYRPSEPPRTLANRVTPGLPEKAARAIGRLALAEERASYSARPSESAKLRRDGTAARRGIASSLGRGSRWRARIFPASVVTALADAAARIPDRVTALVFRRWTERRSTS